MTNINHAESYFTNAERDLDSLYERLFSSAVQDKAKEEAYRKEIYWKEQSEVAEQDVVQQLRKLCKTSSFFLGKAILDYKKLSPRLHGHYCRWLDDTRRDKHSQFTMTLLPRSHYKSTVKTKISNIQASLPDATGEFRYPFNLGPNIRILIGHEIAHGAQRFLYEITQHFLSNPKLMALYPQLVPDLRYNRVNKHELELPRSSNWSEPTFDTMGVGGRNQGKHWDLLNLDDIFGEAARDSKTEREGIIQWIDNIQSFLVELPRSIIDFIGTRWSVDDVYAHIMNVYGNKLRKYIRRVEEYNPHTGRSEPIFPEDFPSEHLDILRKNRRVWAAQYANDPKEGLATWDTDWIRFHNRTNVCPVVLFDDKTGITRYRRRDLDVVILTDPAVTLLPGIVVTGVDMKERIHILETVKHEMDPTEFIETLFELNMKWWPRVVTLEEVAFSEVYKHWLYREFKFRKVRFNIETYRPPKNKMKLDRIDGNLRGLFSNKMITMHASEIDKTDGAGRNCGIYWEIENFGATDNIHLLDALAQGPMGVWRKPKSQSVRNKKRKFVERLDKSRDSLTGYSVI